MASKTMNKPNVGQTFLLDRVKKRRGHFSSLNPKVISLASRLRSSVAHATKDSLWISYERDLTEALLRSLSWPARPLGTALLIHAMKPETLTVLASCFSRFASATHDSFLPPNELAEVLEADNRPDLFIGGSIDHSTRTITLWRGNLEPITVPFSAFEKSGDGMEPDFKNFSIADFGQTIRLGKYEAATDAILYEFDPEYRRRKRSERLASEQTLGASIRRLRKQRGLTRDDFEPLASKTLARIEQGKVTTVHGSTLATIAKVLGVRSEEIGEY